MDQALKSLLYIAIIQDGEAGHDVRSRQSREADRGRAVGSARIGYEYFTGARLFCVGWVLQLLRIAGLLLSSSYRYSGVCLYGP